MSVLRVNSVTDENNSSVTFSKGIFIETSRSIVSDLTISGVCTAGLLQGDGSALTNVPGATSGTAIGFTILIS
jgi:hypothetical protein